MNFLLELTSPRSRDRRNSALGMLRDEINVYSFEARVTVEIILPMRERKKPGPAKAA